MQQQAYIDTRLEGCDQCTPAEKPNPSLFLPFTAGTSDELAEL